MKWDFKMVVLIVEWSSFWGGLKAGFYCTCHCGYWFNQTYRKITGWIENSCNCYKTNKKNRCYHCYVVHV